MNDSGYTLIETLAALMILSLAIGGMSAGVQVLAGDQSRVSQVVADTQSIRAAQSALDRLFEGQGPFRSQEPERFTGTGSLFRFACGQDAACVVQLEDTATGAALRTVSGGRSSLMPLRTHGSARFVYYGDLGASDVWPPTRQESQHLRSISIVRAAGAEPSTLLKTKLWVEEAVICQFDVVMQDCR